MTRFDILIGTIVGLLFALFLAATAVFVNLYAPLIAKLI